MTTYEGKMRGQIRERCMYGGTCNDKIMKKGIVYCGLNSKKHLKKLLGPLGYVEKCNQTESNQKRIEKIKKFTSNFQNI